jgi:hypothetical protein
MSNIEPAPTYIPAAPGLRWVGRWPAILSDLTLADAGRPCRAVGEPIIAWRIMQADGSPESDTVRPVTLQGERLRAETNEIEGVLYPDGRVETVCGLHFPSLDEYWACVAGAK